MFANVTPTPPATKFCAAGLSDCVTARAADFTVTAFIETAVLSAEREIVLPVVWPVTLVQSVEGVVVVVMTAPFVAPEGILPFKV